MTCLDREARSLVPLHGRAGVVRGRALATQLVKAPTLASAFVVKGRCELAALIKGPSIATVMDILTEERGWPAERVELGNTAESQEVREYARDDGGNWRTTRNIDDRFVLDNFGHRDCACRVRIRVRQAAESGARANSDNGEAILCGILQHVQVADAGDRRVSRVIDRNRAVHDKDVLALVLLLRGFAGRLGPMTGCGLQCVMIVERDGVEDQRLNGRRMRTGQRLGAAGAFLEGQPDDRRPASCRERFGNLRHCGWRQGHQ